MEITRDTVNAWLDEHRRDREWLAAQCEVGVAAVGHWLNMKAESPRPIPSKAVIVIENLMRMDEARETVSKTAQNLVLEFEKEDFRNICQAAASGGQAPDEWAEGKLADLARMDVEAIAARLTRGNRKSS
jgi:hypothetical protein